MPFYGFLAVAEKNGVDESIYTQYAMENGLIETAFLGMAFDDLSPNTVDGLDTIIDSEFETSMNKNCDYYSTKWEKVKEDSKITIKNTLTINTQMDFSLMKEKIKDTSVLITKENADYNISLKVGETYTFNFEEKCSGFGFSGASCVEFSEDKTTVTAKEVGICRGMLYFGNSGYTYTDQDGNTEVVEGNRTQKTIYIEVTESANQPGEIEEELEETKKEKEEEKNTNNKKHDITNTKEIPQTGAKENIIIMILTICIIINMIIITIKLKKYNKV